MAGRDALSLLLWGALVAVALPQQGRAELVKIGFVSTDNSANSAELFKRAVVGRSSSALKLVPLAAVVAPDDAAVAAAVCALLDSGVSLVVDDTRPTRASPVSRLCEAHGVPRLALRGGAGVPSRGAGGRLTDFGVSFVPKIDVLAKATHAVLRYLGWRSFTLLYDTPGNQALANELLSDPYFSVSVIKMGSPQDMSATLRAIHDSKNSRLVLALRPRQLLKLQMALPRHGLHTGRHRYFVPTVTASLITLHRLAQSGSTVVALRPAGPPGGRQSRAAKLLEAIDVATAALLSTSGSSAVPPGGLCSKHKLWADGRHLADAIANATATRARSAEVTLSVVEMTAVGSRELLRWRSVDNSLVTGWKARKEVKARKAGKARKAEEAGKAGKAMEAGEGGRQARAPPRLRVVALLSEPYVMLKRTEEGEEELTGNDRYEGYSIDLLDHIADIMGFEYVIELDSEGAYGSYNETSKHWNGMIGALTAKHVHIAIGDLTVTPQREANVDFTDPWHTFGIGLLFYSTDFKDHDYSLFAPFVVEVWIMILGSCVGIAVLFFLLSRLSPYERSPPPIGERTPFTLCFSMWFTFATLFRQFVVQQPRAVSTRLLALVWWFFVIVVVMTYIACLSSHLTFRGLKGFGNNNIRNIYDLPGQRSVTYGAMQGGSTRAFFENSEYETLQRIFARMSSYDMFNPITSNSEGVEQVISNGGRFAYLMEGPSIAYIIERNCAVEQRGSQEGHKQYAIGLQPGSQYLQEFNYALRDLRDSSTLELLYRKWWQYKRGGGRCHMRQDPTEAFPIEIGINFMVVPVIVLWVGAALAILIAVVECCCRASKLSKEKESGLGSEMVYQLKQTLAAPPPASGGVATC